MSPVLIKLMAKKGLYEAAILAKQNELYLMATSPKPVKQEEKIVPVLVPVPPVPEIKPEPMPEPETQKIQDNHSYKDSVRDATRQIPRRGFFKND